MTGSDVAYSIDSYYLHAMLEIMPALCDQCMPGTFYHAADGMQSCCPVLLANQISLDLSKIVCIILFTSAVRLHMYSFIPDNISQTSSERSARVAHRKSHP